MLAHKQRMDSHQEPMEIRILCHRDAESRIWWCSSDDLPGLVTEASSIEALLERAIEAAGELLNANAQEGLASAGGYYNIVPILPSFVAKAFR
jgi:predicted RNase H-like HicB family nuclease